MTKIPKLRIKIYHLQTWHLPDIIRPALEALYCELLYHIWNFVYWKHSVYDKYKFSCKLMITCSYITSKLIMWKHQWEYMVSDLEVPCMPMDGLHNNNSRREIGRQHQPAQAFRMAQWWRPLLLPLHFGLHCSSACIRADLARFTAERISQSWRGWLFRGALHQFLLEFRCQLLSHMFLT